MRQSYLYFNIHHAMNSIRTAGSKIEYVGLNKKLVPFIIGKILNSALINNEKALQGVEDVLLEVWKF